MLRKLQTLPRRAVGARLPLRRPFPCLVRARCFSSDAGSHQDSTAEYQSGGATKFYGGQCHCGSVRYELSGYPSWVAHTHSKLYRLMHASLQVTLVAYKPKYFTLLQGDAYLHRKALETVYKHTCKKCGSHVYDDWLPHRHKIVFLPHLDCFSTAHRIAADWEAFAPQFHIHYDSAVLPVYDGLPKYAHLPKEWRGGTGEMVDESYPTAQAQRYRGETGDVQWPPQAHYATVDVPPQPPLDGTFGVGAERVHSGGTVGSKAAAMGHNQVYTERTMTFKSKFDHPLRVKAPGADYGELYPEAPRKGF
eukprot:Sspe_Gene.40182::Locus_19386_Transcript_1_1_Confidence_1.000_Length_1019::g.40182::m.40182